MPPYHLFHGGFPRPQYAATPLRSPTKPTTAVSATSTLVSSTKAGVATSSATISPWTGNMISIPKSRYMPHYLRTGYSDLSRTHLSYAELNAAARLRAVVRLSQPAVSELTAEDNLEVAASVERNGGAARQTEASKTITSKSTDVKSCLRPGAFARAPLGETTASPIANKPDVTDASGSDSVAPGAVRVSKTESSVATTKAAESQTCSDIDKMI